MSVFDFNLNLFGFILVVVVLDSELNFDEIGVVIVFDSIPSINFTVVDVAVDLVVVF